MNQIAKALPKKIKYEFVKFDNEDNKYFVNLSNVLDPFSDCVQLQLVYTTGNECYLTDAGDTINIVEEMGFDQDMRKRVHRQIIKNHVFAIHCDRSGEIYCHTEKKHLHKAIKDMVKLIYGVYFQAETEFQRNLDRRADAK